MSGETILDRLHDEEDYPDGQPPCCTCAACLRHIPADEERWVCFVGASDGSDIRITRVCLDCAKEDQ